MAQARQQFNVYSPTKMKSKKDGKVYYFSRFTYYNQAGERKQGKGNLCKTASEAMVNAEKKAKQFCVRKEGNDPEQLTIKQITLKYIDYITKLPIDELTRASTKYTKVSNARSLVLGDEELGLSPQTPKYIIDKKIKNLNEDDIRDWIEYIAKLKSDKTGKQLSKVSIDKRLNSMRSILNYAHDKLKCFKRNNEKYERIIRNINRSNIEVGSRREKKKRNNRFMDDKLFRKFMSSTKYPDGYMCNKIYKDYPIANYYEPEHQSLGDELDREYMYYVLFSMFYYSGARTSEIKALTTDDISFDIISSENKNKKIAEFGKITKVRIQKSYCDKCLSEDKDKKEARSSSLKTDASGRIVGILDYRFSNELYHYINYLDNIQGKGTKLLFPGTHVKYISDNAIDYQIQKRLKRVPELTEFSKHDFRRSRITIFLNNGIAPQYLEGYFGHNSTELIEDVYNAQTMEDKYLKYIVNFNNDDFVSKTSEERNEEMIKKTFDKSISKSIKNQKQKTKKKAHH